MYVSTQGCNTGLSGCGNGGGCSCGGNCGNSQFGLGLFDSMDFSTWGWMEWGAVLLGGYVLVSVLSTTKRGYGRVKRGFSKRRRTSKRRKGGFDFRAYSNPGIDSREAARVI